MNLNFEQFNEALDFTYANNTGKQYALALLVFIISMILIKIFLSFIVVRLKKFSKKTKNDLDDHIIEFIEETPFTIYFFAGFFLASKFINLDGMVHDIIHYMLIFALVFYVVKGINKIVDYFAKKEVRKRNKIDDGENVSLVNVLSKIVKVIIWLIGFMFLLSNFGINVTSFIAGLGVGGIAIAFALQSILEDIFSSFSIYFDKPFTEGDFIEIGDDLGVVKQIGLKTTRIEHLQGQELVVSNRELTSTRIHNYKKMKKRRIAFSFGVEYGTPANKLEKINIMIKEIFDKVDIADLDRVHFKKFGDFSLDYEVVYFLDSSDYNVYMDVQEKINLDMVRKFEKAKIEFAFPTQTIILKK